MIERTKDITAIARALEQVKDDLKGEPIEPWVAAENNIALINDFGDVSLFEYRGKPGVYCGHYFFFSRGKDAVKAAKEMLDYVFANHDVRIIIGFTPSDKKGAVWLSRHLGFEDQGETLIDNRSHRVFVMTKENK